MGIALRCVATGQSPRSQHVHRGSCAWFSFFPTSRLPLQLHPASVASSCCVAGNNLADRVLILPCRTHCSSTVIVPYCKALRCTAPSCVCVCDLTGPSLPEPEPEPEPEPPSRQSPATTRPRPSLVPAGTLPSIGTAPHA